MMGVLHNLQICGALHIWSSVTKAWEKTPRDAKRYDVYSRHHVMCSNNKTGQLQRRKTTRL
jgi:hypothetical protein